HALMHYNEVIARFGTNKDVEWCVGGAMLHKAELLDDLGDAAAAIAAYDLFIQQYADNVRLETTVAEARFAKANVLDRNGRSAEAIAFYRSLVAQYGISTDKTLKGIAEQAIKEKAPCKIDPLVRQYLSM